PGQVVARVDQRIVPAGWCFWQLGPPPIVPQLPQVLRKSRDLPGQLRHSSPQWGQRHVVVGGEPRPQLDLFAGPIAHRLDQELPQVVPDPRPGPPRRIPGRGKFAQYMFTDPRHRRRVVELGGDRVELPPVFVDYPDGDQVNHPAVLDELAGVEVSGGHRPRHRCWTLLRRRRWPGRTSLPAMTYSIVARAGDAFGVAVASRFLAVGAVVPAAE